MLHHDPRASLVYACKICLHEWQLEVAAELVEEVLPAAQPSPKLWRLPNDGESRDKFE
jgi:hypothetical protein